MASNLSWTASSVLSDDVVELRFTLYTSLRPIPGVVWLPASPTRPRPAVLLGHGGGSDKLSGRNRRLAELLVKAGLAVVAIDGPFHGERVVAALTPAIYQQMIITEGVQAVSDRMTQDWLGTLRVLEQECVIQAQSVGYIGHSMGARYGLPLAVALGSQLGALVIGKFGLQQTRSIDARLHQPDQITAALQVINAPTLIHIQWDDEVFPRAGGLAMFDLLAAEHKRLIVHPGNHSAAGSEAEQDWANFVAAHLIN